MKKLDTHVVREQDLSKTLADADGYAWAWLLIQALRAQSTDMKLMTYDKVKWMKAEITESTPTEIGGQIVTAFKLSVIGDISAKKIVDRAWSRLLRQEVFIATLHGGKPDADLVYRCALDLHIPCVVQQRDGEWTALGVKKDMLLTHAENMKYRVIPSATEIQ